MTRSGGNFGYKGGPPDVPYFQFFFGPQIRPGGRMPIDAHRECGRLLKQVGIAVEGRKGAHGAVTYARGTLDDWTQREYDHSELDIETLGGLYQPGPPIAPQSQVSRDELISMLETAKLILIRHYPKRLALRRLLGLMDSAIASIRTWNAKPRGKAFRVPSA